MRTLTAKHSAAATAARVIAIGALALLAACHDDGLSPQQRIKSVTISPITAQIDVGATQQLAVSVAVRGSADQSVTWTSNATAIATVSSSGLVVGLAPGDAAIVARSVVDPTKTATATVHVAAGAVVTVQIDPEAAEVVRSTTKQLTVTVLNGSGGLIAGRPVMWMADNPTVATISESGLVTAVEFGQTSITAIVDGIRASAVIVVGAGPVQRMQITPGPISLTMLETATLKAHPFDDVGNEVTFADVVWVSSDPSVATVSGGGFITPIGAGTATITATCDGVAASVAVTITNPVPASIEITPRPSSLEQGESVQLSAVVKDASGRAMTVPISWTSSDPATVTMANGTITAMAPIETPVEITARVQVTPFSTISDKIALSVALAAPASVGVTIDRSPLELTETTVAHATVFDARGDKLTGRPIAWHTSNPSVAAIQPDGIITAVGIGTATITAGCGAHAGSATITVMFSADPVGKITLAVTPTPLVPGMTAHAYADLRDGGGHPTGPRASTWRSSNPHVATIDGNGVITAEMPGWTTISVTSEGVTDSDVLKVLNPNVYITWPLPFGLVFQDDRHTGASYDPVRGYGYRVDMDWLMVLGATGYEVSTTVDGAASQTVTVDKSSYAFVQPNVWVPAGTPFTMQVRALGLPGGPGPWASRTVKFAKCVLLDGTACGTPHVRVSVHTSGADMPKAFGANITPPGGVLSGREVSANGWVDIATVFADDQIVRLVDVPANCSVVESASRVVSLSEMNPYRSVSFDVVCRARDAEGPGL